MGDFNVDLKDIKEGKQVFLQSNSGFDDTTNTFKWRQVQLQEAFQNVHKFNPANIGVGKHATSMNAGRDSYIDYIWSDMPAKALSSTNIYPDEKERSSLPGGRL